MSSQILRVGVIVVWSLAIYLTMVTLAQPDRTPGSLISIARKAKSQGRTEASVRIIVETNAEGSLSEMLRRSSVLVVTPSTSPSIQTASREDIYTWLPLSVEQVLVNRGGAGACRQTRPSKFPVKSGEIGLVLMAGTAIVEGIPITMISPESELRFEPGRSYLMLASYCERDIVGLARGALDVFELSPEGRISFNAGRLPPFQFVREMVELGTLDELTRRIRSLQ